MIHWLIYNRAMGRFGIPFIKKTRSELLEIVGHAMFDYIGECNKLKPTGEEAFNKLHSYGLIIPLF